MTSFQRSDIIDDVISINNSKFGDYVDQIKATEIEKNDTKNTATYVSYHCLVLIIKPA